MTPDYQTPTTEVPATPRFRFLQTVVFLMGWGWVVAATTSGISGDSITIPLVKKIAISASAVIIVGLICWTERNRHVGCIVAFILYALANVGIMWVWN